MPKMLQCDESQPLQPFLQWLETTMFGPFRIQNAKDDHDMTYLSSKNLPES